MPSNKGTTWRTAGAKNEEDIYILYKETATKPLPKKRFKEVLIALNEEFMTMIIEEGKEVRMPLLNMLSIKKTSNPNKYAFDHGHYLKTGEKKLHTNEHSDGFSARFYWRKGKCRIPGKSVYALNIVRDQARRLAKEMKTPGGHVKYAEYIKHYG